jgi:hypothetical protein
MTPKSRTQVQQFVQTTFVDRVRDLPRYGDKVQWFKDWTSLQSVRGLEHLQRHSAGDHCGMDRWGGDGAR